MPAQTFVKQNRTGYDDALLREADGLNALRTKASDNRICIPYIHRVNATEIEMTAITVGPWIAEAWQKLGIGLAGIHSQDTALAGYHRDNYIGLNRQPNRLQQDWGDFFVEYRLGYQVSLIKNEELKKTFKTILDRQHYPLTTFLNSHTARIALVHGDLWTGNVLCDNSGNPWLIDPAVYYGDPEVDLAMTEMFGGFDRRFYEAYQTLIPLSGECATKKQIYNLYHYLNHFNLFGSGYLRGCHQGFELIAQL